MKSLLVFLALSLPCFSMDLTPKKEVDSIRKDIEFRGMAALAERTDKALDVLIQMAVKQLRKEGYDLDANDIESDWQYTYKGYLTRISPVGSLDIGDHSPLSQWLADVYDRIEALLGVDACKALHLSDIKTINFGIPVVFHPKTFPMDNVPISREDEYKNHFCQGEVYYGLGSVVVYYSIDIPCMVASSGAAALVCGPIANAGEFFFANFPCPKLADKILQSSK